MKLQRSEIRLSDDSVIVAIHNLYEFGIGIDVALDNWLARTDEYTSKSFCQYIESKDPINIIAITEEDYKELTDET